MQDGPKQTKQGISIAIDYFAHDECVFSYNIVKGKYHLKRTGIKAGQNTYC